MIVKESIEFKRGGKNPLKSMNIGITEIVRKRLLKAGIGRKELEKTKKDLEELSKWTTGRKEDPKLGRELSIAFNKDFDEEDKQDKSEDPYSNPEARRFIKNLIFQVRKNNHIIDIQDVIEAYIEFMEKYSSDPIWMKEVLEGILYTVQMY